MSRRFLQACTVAIMAAVMLGADATQARFSRLGHEMICVCSCGQVLLECNHVGCPDSDRMITELRERLGTGSADSSVLNWFSQKYGATVLAAPIRGGFDTVAWVLPGALFFLATVGTALVVKSWTARRRLEPSAEGAWPGTATDASLHRDRIRRETEI